MLENIRRWKALDWKWNGFFLENISWCVIGNGEFTFYCHFCAGISSSRSSTVSFEGSPLSAGGTEGSLISIQYYPNLSSTAPNVPGSESPKYVKIILASNIPLEIAFVCLLHLHIFLYRKIMDYCSSSCSSSSSSFFFSTREMY